MTLTTTLSSISTHATSHMRRAPLHFSLGRFLAVASCAALFACGGDPSATEPPNIAQNHSDLGSTVGLDDPLLFDAQYYSSLYPDLAAAFGGNATALRSHWLTNGIREGRRASPIFDCNLYLSIYPDLRNAFGTDCALAMGHYLNTGLPLESRRASIEFEPSNYLARYPDLTKAFGKTGYKPAAQHFMALGLWSEGRAGSNEFDVSYYICHYPDLGNAFGGNFRAAIEHFDTGGLPIEARRGSALFDVGNYLSRYADLRAAFGTNYQAAMNHWLINGIKEGRTGNPGDNGGDFYCPLPAPSNFRSSGTTTDWTSKHGALLGWDVVPGAAYYDIRRSAPNGGTTMVASQQMTGTANWYSWGGLEMGVYTFQIGACNTKGSCTYSSTFVTSDTRDVPTPMPSSTGAVWFKYYDSLSIAGGSCLDQRLSLTLSPSVWNLTMRAGDADFSSCPGIKDFTKYKCCGWELAQGGISPGNYSLSFTKGQTCSVSVPVSGGKTQVVTSHEGQCPPAPSPSPTTAIVNVYFELQSPVSNCGSATITLNSSYVQNPIGTYWGTSENGKTGSGWCWYNTTFYNVAPGSYTVYAQGGAYSAGVTLKAGDNATVRLN